MAIIFVMIDGVGVAAPGPHNPVVECMHHWAERFEHPLTGSGATTTLAHWHAIDATLGVAGLPQSGTGHSSIYGGFNAAMFNGRHQPSYPTIAMRARLAEHNLLSAAVRQGRHVAWANAYLPGYAEAVAGRRLRHTAGTWSAIAAGLRLRTVEDLRNGSAVAWDIDQRLASTRPDCADLEYISPYTAGERLSRLAQTHDLVCYETYVPDLAGHERIPSTPGEALKLVDGLLHGVILTMRPADTLIVVSDHGNVEDMTTRVHTRNPVPLRMCGVQLSAIMQVTAIDGVMDALLSLA